MAKQRLWESYRARALKEALHHDIKKKEAELLSAYERHEESHPVIKKLHKELDALHGQRENERVSKMSMSGHIWHKELGMGKKSPTDIQENVSDEFFVEELTPREQQSHKERLDAPKTPPVTHHQKVHVGDGRHITVPISPSGYKTYRDAREKEEAKKNTPSSRLKEDYDYPDPGPSYKVGDRVVTKIGPHKGEVHRVIHVWPTGHVNITPANAHSRNRYHLGAAKADPKDLERAPMNESLLSRGGRVWNSTGLSRITVQEIFQAAKDKKKDTDGKGTQKELQDPNALPTAGANEPNKDVEAGPPQGKDEKKQNNTPKPEKSGGKLTVKGPGADDKFQADPIVTPLTTMPDTASPKSGSQGVR